MGGSSGLAAVVTSRIFSTKSPISASEWLITTNLMFNLPAAVSEMRYPESSKYLASGCLFEITVSVASDAVVCFGCAVSVGAEQPARHKISATKRNLTISNILHACLLYTSPSPRDRQKSRM